MTTLNITNIQDPNTKEIIYYFYTMPDLTNISRYQDQAKPLLEAVKKAFEKTKEQTEALYKKQIEIAKHYQIEIGQLKEKLNTNENQDGQAEIQQLRLEIEQLKQERNKLVQQNESDTQITADQIQQLTDQTNKSLENKQDEIFKANQDLNDALDKIKQLGDLLENKQVELNQANTAEEEIREHLEQTSKDKEEIEIKATKSIEALEAATTQIEQLKKQIEALKNKQQSSCNYKSSTTAECTTKQKINLAFETAMARFKNTPKDSDSNSIISINDVEINVTSQQNQKIITLKSK